MTGVRRQERFATVWSEVRRIAQELQLTVESCWRDWRTTPVVQTEGAGGRTKILMSVSLSTEMSSPQ